MAKQDESALKIMVARLKRETFVQIVSTQRFTTTSVRSLMSLGYCRESRSEAAISCG